jgi:PAS domain S-box-containing protein
MPEEARGSGAAHSDGGERRAQPCVAPRVLDPAEFEALVAGAPDGVIVVDEAGRIRYANAQAEAMFGFPPGGLVELPVEELLPPSARAAHVAHRERYGARPRVRPMGAGLDLVGRRRDGSEFPVDVSLSPLRSRGRLLVTAFVRDVSERKAAERALRESEERFRLLVEGVVDHALFMLDTEGRVASWNAGAQRLTGYRAEEVLGRPVAMFFLPEDRAALAPEAELAEAAAGVSAREGWRQRKDGSRFLAQVSLTAVRSDRGELRGYAALLRDVTAARRAASRMAAVAELTGAILRGVPSDGVLSLTASHARALVDGALAWVVGSTEPGGPPVVLAADGAGAEELVGAAVAGHDTAGEGGRAGEDGNAAPDGGDGAGTGGRVVWLSEEGAECAVWPPGRGFGLGTTLCAPLRAGSSAFGVLAVAAHPGVAGFSDEEVEVVRLFADQAALALYYGRMRADLQRLSLIEDRARIARDLHDTVIQRLFATGLGLQAVVRLVEVPEVRAAIDRAVAELDETIRQIRTTIFDLRMGMADRPGLRQRVLGVVAESLLGLDLVPTVEFSGAADAEVDEAVGAQLLPTLREALSNVVRHAQATRVEVRISLGEELVLQVADDGVGLPPKRLRRGSGLENLAARAAALGGRSRVGRRPGGGTLLEWRVPLRD